MSNTRQKKRLTEIEREKGIVLADTIPSLVNEGGQKLAADVLGVSQFSICDWLMRNGYVRVTQYVKVEQEDKLRQEAS